MKKAEALAEKLEGKMCKDSGKKSDVSKRLLSKLMMKKLKKKSGDE